MECRKRGINMKIMHKKYNAMLVNRLKNTNKKNEENGILKRYIILYPACCSGRYCSQYVC